MHIPIIYQNDDVLIINKPCGLIVFPEGNVKEKTLIEFLTEQFPGLKDCGSAPRYGIVHRLDKDTSGLLLIAKNDKTLQFLQKEFKTRRVAKTYMALVSGELKENSGKIEELAGRSKDGTKQMVYPKSSSLSQTTGARNAITYWKVLKRFKGFTLIACRPKTGRKHQLRVHLQYINHPIAGDTLYRFKNQEDPEGLKRIFLHAYKIKFNMQGELKSFIAPLPEDLKQVLNNLKTYETN